jgi:hypothetical protein
MFIQGNIMQPTATLRFTAPLKIVYSLTLGGVATWYLFFYLEYCLGNFGWTGDNVFSVFLVYLPMLFTISAIPLAIFTVVFLTKGKGLDYFRSWNVGKALSLSALAIIIGYLLVVFAPTISGTRWLSPHNYNFYCTYPGLFLIAAGLVSILLCKRLVSSDGEEPKRKIKWRSTKTVLIFSGILIFSIIIGGYHFKLQREHEMLQEQYLQLKEGLPFLVNDEWTNIESGDSKYVNVKGAIFNSGLETKYNVTLLVFIRDADGVRLETAEIPIGDISGLRYEAFDVNVEYSGEMATVSTTYSWDSSNSVVFG